MDPFLSDRHARWHPSGFVLTMETEGTTIGLISLEKGLDISKDRKFLNFVGSL